MNILAQFAILLLVLLGSEFLVDTLALKIPGTILGMIILFLLLVFKIIKLEWIEDITRILNKHMGLMLVPPGVAIINYLDLLKDEFIKILIISILSLLTIMFVTGKTIDFLLERKEVEN